jgi:anti-sigma factor RsiW
MKKITHPIEELELMAYLDGELPRERAAHAAAHLEECRECQKMAADLRGVTQSLASWEVPASELRLTSRISVALEEQSRAQEKIAGRQRGDWLNFLRMPRVWAGALAAAVVVLLMVTPARRDGVSTKALSSSGPTNQIASDTNGSYSRDRAVQQRKKPQDAITTGGATRKDQAADGYAGSGGIIESAAPSPVPPPPPPKAVAPSRGQGYGSVGKLAQEPSAAKVGDAVANSAPMVARTANLTVTTKDFDKARAGLEEILKRHQGYLGELNVTGATGSARALETTLRVPATQLDSTLAELKKLGQVESESQTGEEVTQQYVDLQARLTNARHTEERLSDILRQRTGKLSDVLEVELEVDRVRGEIEQMDAEKRELSKRVAFATINVKLTEEYKAQLQAVPNSTSTRFRNAAVEGYQTLVDGLIGLGLFLLSWGPALLVWGAIVFYPVRFGWRRIHRSVI